LKEKFAAILPRRLQPDFEIIRVQAEEKLRQNTKMIYSEIPDEIRKIENSLKIDRKNLIDLQIRLAAILNSENIENLALEVSKRELIGDIERAKENIYENINHSLKEYNSLEVSAKKIFIPNPKPISVYIEKGGFGGSSSVDETTGDITLSFRINNSQVFEKVEIITQSLDLVRLSVTERTLDGSLESYFLEYGKRIKAINVKGKEENCLKIICQSGNSQTIFFGENKVNYWMGIVKKPVIAFRDFDKIKLKVVVNFSGEYKVIYPEVKVTSNNDLVWNCQVFPDNSIQIGKKKFPYLFWDGTTETTQEIKFDCGFCVAKDKVIKFLENICSNFGFDSSLTADFVTFWSPFLLQK